MSVPLTRRVFNFCVASLPWSLLRAGESESTGENLSGKFTGPMIGHVTTTTARIWFRPGVAGDFTVVVKGLKDQTTVGTFTAAAVAENDYCLIWDISNLQPRTQYTYSIVHNSRTIVSGPDCVFCTAPALDEKTQVRLAFGSCADMQPLKLWTDMQAEKIEGLILLGDTPYIDSTRLEVARDKHRQFLSIEPLARLIRRTPTWGTWDDHDFGKNDSDGRLAGKENTRKAFTEYRANSPNGEHEAGIYCKFNYGPVDVFLLDTRWFARTEPSPADETQPTLLGARQWIWLLKSLQESKADFKIIACGMIWDDKENRESDDWGTYEYERKALFEFIGQQQISGVLLIGGDIHCSRLLKYKTESVVGYPIYQLIVSPIHDRVIPSLNVAHPDLLHGSATPHVWLKLDVDSTQHPPRLRAEWMQMDGQPMWTLEVTTVDLKS